MENIFDYDYYKAGYEHELRDGIAPLLAEHEGDEQYSEDVELNIQLALAAFDVGWFSALDSMRQSLAGQPLDGDQEPE